ncbi:MAG: hypothetical protein LBV00_12715 [Propionibacteriaceae bacterium]|nr:hypothetical protein [Propionibacteriaceae bacterium]
MNAVFYWFEGDKANAALSAGAILIPGVFDLSGKAIRWGKEIYLVIMGGCTLKKVRFLIEYGCYPLWPAEESTGFFYGPGAPVEVKARPELMADLEQTEDIWNSLYIDNEIELGWKGFGSEGEEQAFARR